MENSNQVIQQTQEFWNQKTGQEITQQEAWEMIYNISGFFKILAEWEETAKNKNLI